MHIFALSRQSFDQLVTKNNGKPHTKHLAQLKKFFCLTITGAYAAKHGSLWMRDKIMFLHKRKQRQDVAGRHTD